MNISFKGFRALSTKIVLAGLVTLSFCLGIQKPRADALDAVTCVNCANEGTQLWSKLTQAKQLAMQGKQLANQIQQYEILVTNSKTIPRQLWGNALNDFKQLQSLMQKSRALASNAGNIDKEFSSRYGTYESYLKPLASGR
jgi:type IV secretion system protein TrbJ